METPATHARLGKSASYACNLDSWYKTGYLPAPLWPSSASSTAPLEVEKHWLPTHRQLRHFSSFAVFDP